MQLFTGPGRGREPSRSDRIGNWINVAENTSGAGLPGHILLSPAVWLCCVYLCSSNADRLDSTREALRLGSLLRTAALAWLEHVGNAGSGHCVFRFQPESQPHLAQTCAQEFMIRLQIDSGSDGLVTTRLEFAS